VAQRHVEGVRWLLTRGVDVNARRTMWDCNSTALHVATEHGAMDLVRLLLEAGADPNIRDGKYEGTALEWAEFCGWPEIAELLRGCGAAT